jgi:hypothetical protein
MRIAGTVLPFIALFLNVSFLKSSGDEIPAHVLSLARINHRMADELKRLPNYTCIETIDRYAAAQGGKRKPFDRIRINVAIVGGKELYSWPGAKSFEDRGLAEMVNTGFISDGDFSAMTNNVFVQHSAVVIFAGQEVQEGRSLLRYNFEISQMRSGWQVRLRGASGIVGAKGWFLADATTYDLVRFSFAAVDLPPFSPDKHIVENIEYGRVRLGSADILIPLIVDLESESYNGDVHWNHAAFDGCRKYGAESSITFGDENTPAPAAQAEEKKEELPEGLPPGLEIQLKLVTAVDSAHAAVGDEIRAVVSKNVRIDSETILPRGAIVKGVIRRFDRHVGNRPYCAVGIEFTEAAYEGRRVVIFGKMDGISKFTGLHKNVIGFGESADRPPISGVGYFYVEGESFTIPQGLSLVWVTESFRTR